MKGKQKILIKEDVKNILNGLNQDIFLNNVDLLKRNILK